MTVCPVLETIGNRARAQCMDADKQSRMASKQPHASWLAVPVPMPVASAMTMQLLAVPPMALTASIPVLIWGVGT